MSYPNTECLLISCQWGRQFYCIYSLHLQDRPWQLLCSGPR